MRQHSVAQHGAAELKTEVKAEVEVEVEVEVETNFEFKVEVKVKVTVKVKVNHHAKLSQDPTDTQQPAPGTASVAIYAPRLKDTAFSATRQAQRHQAHRRA